MQSLSLLRLQLKKIAVTKYRNFWGEIELASGEPFATARPVSVSEGFLRTVSLMLFFLCIGCHIPVSSLKDRNGHHKSRDFLMQTNCATGICWRSICSTRKCGHGCGMVCEHLSRFVNACESEGNWPFSPSKDNVGQHAPWGAHERTSKQKITCWNVCVHSSFTNSSPEPPNPLAHWLMQCSSATKFHKLVVR